MLDYRLDDLGWYEFERLCQAVLKFRLGLGVEAWGGSSDWGRDAFFDGKLKYPTNDLTNGPFVFQSKFIDAANAAGAKPHPLIIAAVRKERERIKKRLDSVRERGEAPKNYVLLTNAPVSPHLREEIAQIIGSVIPKTQVRIHDGNDLCQWLRLSPDIVRSFPQLLSLRDLQDLLHDAVHADTLSRSESAISLASAYVRIFVPTKSYFTALEKLDKHHFVVLEGPPEMGKTTIGRIIALNKVYAGWDAIECRKPTEVLASFHRPRSQVFVADDFFGRTEYDPTGVSDWQSELPYILTHLDSNHWLILTSRAHLLEMAKSNLDIPGQDGRFPELGQVVVNASELTLQEKARILYRHAKVAGLNENARNLIKQQAKKVVANSHFTPERIRRLIEEVVPVLGSQHSLSETVISDRIADALHNPTKGMRVSFRKLPIPHRWLLYALLEADRVAGLAKSRRSLVERYRELCPKGDQHPYERVLDELTQAFVRKFSAIYGQTIDWIHPSCRDLAIEELSECEQDRARFLQNCSETGLVLASSVGGGLKGERDLPLLLTNNDWEYFRLRGMKVLSSTPILLNSIWKNYTALLQKKQTGEGLLSAAGRLRSIIQDNLLPVAVRVLNEYAYSNVPCLAAYYEICEKLEITPDLTLHGCWEGVLEDADSWKASTDIVLWDDTSNPKAIMGFLKVVGDNQPALFQDHTTRTILHRVGSLLKCRAQEEVGSSYACPSDRDEISSMMEGLEMLEEAFKELAQLPVFEEEDRRCFERFASSCAGEASSLGEHLPQEPDWDDELFSSEPSDDVAIEEIFKDL